MLTGALIIPRIGVTTYVIALTSLTFAPLILPMIWGLYSRYLQQNDVIATVVISFVVVGTIKFGLAENGALSRFAVGAWLHEILSRNTRVSDIAIGNGIPMLSLLCFEIWRRLAKSEAKGWYAIQDRISEFRARPVAGIPSLIPSQVVSGSLAVLAISLAAIGFLAPEDKFLLFLSAFILLAIAGGILGSAVAWRNRLLRRLKEQEAGTAE